MRWLVMSLLLVGCGAADDGLATLELPIASALPARIDGFELRLDGEVRRFDAPFADPLLIEVEAGRYQSIEAVGRAQGVPVLVGYAADVEAVEGAVSDVDLVLDPGGRLLLLTVADLGGVVRFVARPIAPPPGTPSEFALVFETNGYVGVVPTGPYQIIAIVGAVETEVDVIEVVEGESPVQLDLDRLNDLF